MYHVEKISVPASYHIIPLRSDLRRSMILFICRGSPIEGVIQGADRAIGGSLEESTLLDYNVEEGFKRHRVLGDNS